MSNRSQDSITPVALIAADCSAPNMSRRQAFGRAGAAALALLTTPAWAHALARLEQPQTMTVFKSPTCGCCTAWIEHVEKAGFKCIVRDFADLTEVKRTFGIPRALESCHTAQIGSYVVEGHVPADLIKKMLTDKPAGRGLAVPGMPIGSPGMEGGTPERYQVLFLNKDGTTRVYANR